MPTIEWTDYVRGLQKGAISLNNYLDHLCWSFDNVSSKFHQRRLIDSSWRTFLVDANGGTVYGNGRSLRMLKFDVGWRLKTTSLRGIILTIEVCWVQIFSYYVVLLTKTFFISLSLVAYVNRSGR